MATINHKTYNEATETFKDFNVYDGKETLIFKVDGADQTVYASNIIGSGNATFDTTTLVVDALGDRVILGAAASLQGDTLEIHAKGDGSAISTFGRASDNGSSLSFRANGATTLKAQIYGSDDGLSFTTGTTQRMRITSAGNVAIGATGPAGTEFAQLYIGADNTIMRGGGDLNISNNGYYRGGWKRVATGAASLAYQSGGEFEFYTAPSSTADSPISWSSKLKITEGGNVGIGTSSPEAKVHLNDISTGGPVGMYIRNSAASTLNNSADIYFGTWGGSAVSGITNARISAVNVSAGNAESNIDFYTYNGSASGKRVSITSNGLTFNGDTAAANALDDYEEGTFNFDITFGGSDTGVTYLNRLGAYTKIGRQVTCQGWIRLANKGTATGNAAIKGLPFTIGTGAQFYNGGCIGYIGGISFADQISSYALQGDNGYELVESTNAGVLSPITDADFTSNAEIMVSFTYFV